MLSIIIPTIQKKPKILASLVNLLKDEECVSEIIIINNLIDTPIPETLFTENNYQKIKMVTTSKNLYVNPSWNMGVMLSKNENFALFNDDLLVCKGFCQKVIESDTFNDENSGMIGLNPYNITDFPSQTEILDLPIADDNAELNFSVLNKYLGTGNWGSAIFGKKSKWYNIPSDFRVIYGDNYILKKQLDDGKINYQIDGMPVYHVASSSSRDKCASKEVCRDIKHAERYFNL